VLIQQKGLPLQPLSGLKFAFPDPQVALATPLFV
jgi:hypothetical protein